MELTGDDGFDKVLQKINGDGGPAPVAARRGGRFVYRLIGVAAVFAGLTIAGALWLKFNPIEKQTYVVTTGNSVSSFTLPDGTQVSLNKNSSLSYSGQYGAKVRAVSVNGEAWFDVARDEEHKFIVDMGPSRITVLGTEFTARYVDTEQAVMASLVSGSLRFETKDQSIMLTPGNQVVYNDATGEVNVDSFDPDVETAWKDNIIRYKSMAFRVFVDMLSDKYNVSIRMSDKKLDNLRISGSIDSGQSIEQVLDMIKYAVPYKWERVGEEYIITPFI